MNNENWEKEIKDVCFEIDCSEGESKIIENKFISLIKNVLASHDRELCERLDKEMGIHNNWKGDNAGYHAIHLWIEKHWEKKSKCENTECTYPRKNAARSWVLKPKRYEWALKKGRNYSRNREDYMELCKSCHSKYDYGLQVGSLT